MEEFESVCETSFSYFLPSVVQERLHGFLTSRQDLFTHNTTGKRVA
jgi:hypothetical protein